jgi:hypothetical protein
MSDGLGFGKRNLIKQIVKDNWALDNPSFKKYTYNELLFIIQEMMNEEGKNYHESKDMKRGHHIFREFVKLLLYRNMSNYDSMILITSEKGTGKSSAAIMLARAWCKMLGKKFDPNKYIAYNNADMMNKIDSLDKFDPIIADEAVRFATSADWALKENKELKKKLAQVRTKHLLFILCFPLKIKKVEKNYLESFTNYWIDLFGRGQGAMYIKDRNPVKDSWNMKAFEKIGSYNEFTNTSKVEKLLKKHPNFWQIIKFPKPPAWLYENYLKVREKNVYDDENVLVNVSKQDMHYALLTLALRDIMQRDTSVSMNRIILHIKNEYDVNMSKGMVMNTIEDAKQLVVKIRQQVLKL